MLVADHHSDVPPQAFETEKQRMSDARLVIWAGVGAGLGLTLGVGLSIRLGLYRYSSQLQVGSTGAMMRSHAGLIIRH